MSSALWVDATYGAAGDMLLGALIDAGAPIAAVRTALTGLADAGSEAIVLDTEPVRRHGLRATRALVSVPTSSVRRGPSQISALVRAARLSASATRFSLAVFDALARAEAYVHGVPLEAVHFHEVGALDALADVVGCAVALDELGLLAPDTVRRVSPIALGGGTARTEHGVIPVPVPATLQLLQAVGAPVSAGAGDRELCTPTGAALLATLATGWGSLPVMSVSATGSGAGTWDPVDRPNLVRVVIGQAVAPAVELAIGLAVEPRTAQAMRQDDLRVVETTVDDLDPRLWPDVLAQVHTAGALDTWLTPVLMRHGRPGHVLTALCPPDRADAVIDVVLTATTTLGVRIHPVSRRSLHRDRVTVDVDGVSVGVKRGLLGERIVTAQPEYTDARAAAQTLGLPIGEVLHRAGTAARETDAAQKADASRDADAPDGEADRG